MTDQPDNCTEGIQAQDYLNHAPFRSLLFVYAITNFLCIGTNITFLVHVFHKIFLPPHIKILMKAQIFFNMVHGFFTLALTISHMYLFLTAQSSCDIIVTRLFCIFFKIPVDTAVGALVTITAAVVLERVFATWKLQSFEKSKIHYGRILCTVAVSLAIVFGVYINTRIPLSTHVPYCSTNSAQTFLPSVVSGTILLIIELISIIIFFIICFINKRWKQRLKFNVTLRYQVDENIDVLSIIWPWMLAHVIFIIVFYCGVILPPRLMDWSTDEMALRTLIGYNYLIQIGFSTLSPLLMWVVFVWRRRKRKQRLVKLETRATGDQYYSAYSSMW